jgi:hypothetical protein
LSQADTVEELVYKGKSNELKGEAAKTDESLATLGDVDPARGEIALAIFDFTQKAADRWRGSNNAIRREILDLVCLNRALGDVNLDATKRKPFDVFAEGLDLKRRIVGVTGFEPATSWSRTKRSSQAEPHPGWAGRNSPLGTCLSYPASPFGQRHVRTAPGARWPTT